MSTYPDPPPAAGNSLTQAVDILAFVEAQEIPPDYFETPYYLAPAPGGEKDYALLRETLHRTRKIGIAYVVIQARQHLAALIPHGQSLVLNTLRWNREEQQVPKRSSETRLGTDSSLGKTGFGASGFGVCAAPLQQMRVTGCDDGVDPDDEFDIWAEEGLFDSDDLMRAFLRPRSHSGAPRASRSTTARRPHGTARVRRIVRRA